MAFGFLKKMFFADNIAPLVNEIFADPVGLESFTILIGSLGFMLQLYGDFSGYTDIAIGAALILGFNLPINFRHPFFATSPSDWTKRWHITLFSWLRDYLYIPLGGSKKGHLRTYLNLWLVMFFVGLWHGASWNFALWGLVIGTILAGERIIKTNFPSLKNNPFFKSKIGIILCIVLTQYLLMFGVTSFRTTDTDAMLYSMEKYIFWDFEIEDTLKILKIHKFSTILIGVFLIFEIAFFKIPKLIERIARSRLAIWGIILMGITLLIMFFYDANPDAFIYFQF